MSLCVVNAGQDHIQVLIGPFRRLHEEKAAARQELRRVTQARHALQAEATREYSKAHTEFAADVAACQGANDPAACVQAARDKRDRRIRELHDLYDPQLDALAAQAQAASERYDLEAPKTYARAAHDAGVRFAGAVDGCVPGSMTWRGRTGGAPSEILPDETYMAPGADRFIKQATSFHTAWNLNPVVVRHAYDLLAHIGAGASTKRRIRIVTHATPDVLVIPVFGTRGGSKLDDIWLRTISGGSVAIYQYLLGVDIDGPGWQGRIGDVLARLDPNAPYYTALTLNNPSQQVQTLLVAEVMAGARENGSIRFPAGTTGAARSRYGECVVAWQEACRRALAGIVQQATLEAFARAVRAESTGVRPGATPTLGGADERRRWLADARGALDLGQRLDTDLKAGRDACDTDTAVDIRGCTLDANTLALFAELIDIPAGNVSGSQWFSSYPEFTLGATSWECRLNPRADRNATKLARNSLTQAAVEELAELIHAPDLAEVAVGDKVKPWADLPRRHKLIAMLEVWLFVAGSTSVAGGKTMARVVLDLGFDCAGMGRESLEVFLRSQWANATADRVGRVRDQWLASNKGQVPVLVEKKQANSPTAMPFQELWSDQIITG
jgi:hypothetical protein